VKDTFEPITVALNNLYSRKYLWDRNYWVTLPLTVFTGR